MARVEVNPMISGSRSTPTTSQVLRERYVGTDVGDVERFLSQNYFDVSMRVPCDRPVLFEHESLAAADFAVNRLTCLSGFEVRCPPHRQVVITTVQRGWVTWIARTFGEVRAGPGDTVLAPTDGGFEIVAGPVELDVVVLDPVRVAEHAARLVDLSADALEFTGMTPVSACMGDFWRDAVAHVRTDVLGEPWAGSQAVVLDQAFRYLASALLSAFPNTALTRATRDSAA